MADISKIKLPDGNTYDVKDTSKSSATNWVNGSATGSVRTTGSTVEDSNYTIGIYAVAEGIGTKASGQYSHAEGGGTIASGSTSHAEGGGTTASGNYSHAEGGGATASGNYSHTEGNMATASGDFSHTEGNYTIASGNFSHVEGWSTIANHAYQHVFGQCNIEDPSTASADSRGNYIEIVGNGANSSNRSNARTLDWSGNEVLAGKLTVGVAGTNSLDVATIGQLPTKTSDLTNDSGFITSDSDEKLRIWDIAGQSSTLGYIIIGNGTAAQIRSYDSLNFYYSLTKGTTSSGGTAELILGNGLDDTTDKNTRGQIRLYGVGNNSTLLRTSVLRNNNIIDLPNKSGTIALTSDIPTKTSDLTNDSGFITSSSLPVPLIGTTETITPTQVLNALQAGRTIYITHSVIEEDEVTMTFTASYFNYNPDFGLIMSNGLISAFGINSFELAGWTSNDYWELHSSRLAEYSNIPTKTSDLTNDSGFITGYTETDPVFTASAAHGISTTDITNWNSKQAALVSGTNIKTVNGNSLLGSGDIIITGGSQVQIVRWTENLTTT